MIKTTNTDPKTTFMTDLILENVYFLRTQSHRTIRILSKRETTVPPEKLFIMIDIFPDTPDIDHRHETKKAMIYKNGQDHHHHSKIFT